MIYNVPIIICKYKQNNRYAQILFAFFFGKQKCRYTNDVYSSFLIIFANKKEKE